MPASVEVKLKVAVALLLSVVGLEVIVVSGGEVSTVQLNVAGEGSTLLARSMARTAKLCAPPARLV